MASIAHYWNLNFGIIWHLLLLTVFISRHCDLKASRHCLELIGRSNIAVLQARSHWVNIEEGVLSMLNVGDGLAVKRLMPLVAHSW